MLDQIRTWKHVFKLDPERAIADSELEQLCMSGTHAIMVGGSTGVTFDNTNDLLKRIRRYDVPCVLEVSDQDAVVPGFDLHFIPIVLNTNEAHWLIGKQHQAIKDYGPLLNWNSIAAEGYIILNRDSAAARVTKAKTDLDVKDVLSYAAIADKLFRLPLCYIEYSGKFGDMELVGRVRSTLQNARLFYGGGIDNLEKAQQAAAAAHTIVVGNAIYENFQQALETVKVLERTDSSNE